MRRLAYAYLLIPFILFCLGWLRLFLAIPITLLILWAFWKITNYQLPITNYQSPITNYQLPTSALLITLWLFLSGVGGYAFQNWDHNWRNAVLHDLITYDLPVIYSAPEKGAIKMLVYYVGYWLPATWAGKAFGWSVANFVLFLWTWLGVFLTTLFIGKNLKTSALNAAILLIFFSGMDAIGTLLYPSDYPHLIPPIQHLEVWADKLQYSSFTTQLFWTFNQAVPAWLCIALILDSDSLLSEKILAWSLCFFFAPLISVGLLPYLLMSPLQKPIKHKDTKGYKGKAFSLLTFVDFVSFVFKDLFAVEPLIDFKIQNPKSKIVNFLAAVIVAVSYLYFSTNTAAQERGFQFIPVKDFLIFFLLEGGMIWLLLAPILRRNPRWIITGVLLFAIPFIQLGNGQDFMMRVSIAPLFYLMLATGKIIFHDVAPRLLRITLSALLLIGAITPLYEMNRSIYRTYEYYFLLDETQRAQPPAEPITHLEQPGALEFIHPNALVADEIQTLKFMNDELSKNFIANVRQSFFYRYISSR